MRIEILGSGGYHPTEHRHTACLLLAELGLMLDAGTGAFRIHDRVAELPSPRLEVLLTHAHLDHIAGLTYLFDLRKQGEPVETVVHARPEVLEVVRDHLLASEVFPIQPVTRFAPLSDQVTLASGAEVQTFPLDHPGGSLGVRITAGGKSMAYVTDTRRPTPETIEAIRGVDLLLHEAYFPEAKRELADLSGHCTARDAAEVAIEAGAARLLMVHPDPRASQAMLELAEAEARELRPDAEYARDRMKVDL